MQQGPSKETPISRYPNLSYGLPETHTTILPYVSWLTIACANNDANGVKLPIRMNGINDIYPITTNADPGSGNAFASSGIYTVPAGAAGLRATTTYPYAFASNAAITITQPAWSRFWGAMYQYYTVLGCEYEITMVNPNGTVGADVLIAINFDSYTDAESSAENQTPDANLYDLMAFKKMKFKKLSYVRPSSTDNTYVLQGRYKQGMIKHNVRNDSDAKTWTDIDTTGEPNIPSLNDMLNIRVFKHPLAYTSAAFVVNLQILS